MTCHELAYRAEFALDEMQEVRPAALEEGVAKLRDLRIRDCLVEIVHVELPDEAAVV